MLSLNLVFLTIEKSVLMNRGPIKTFRPRLPKWTTPLGDTGWMNNVPDGQTLPGRGSQTALGNHWLALPKIGTDPTASGRRVELPVKPTNSGLARI